MKKTPANEKLDHGGEKSANPTARTGRDDGTKGPASGKHQQGTAGGNVTSRGSGFTHEDPTGPRGRVVDLGETVERADSVESVEESY